MTTHAEQVRELFCAALELPATERKRFLAEACPDSNLRAEVTELLEQPLPPDFLAPPPIELLLPGPRQFGPFLAVDELPTEPPSWRCREPGEPGLVRVELVPGPRDDAALARFAAAVHRAAAARLPGLLGAVRHGRLPDATYLAEQTCDGHSLQQELQADPASSERLLPPRASEEFVAASRRLIASLAGTLASLHGMGLVHGDLRSGRIWLDRQGHAHLFGLGLYLLAPDTRPAARPTAAEDIRGLLQVLAELLAHAPAGHAATQALQALHRRHSRRRSPDLRTLAAELSGAQQTTPHNKPAPRWRWLARWFADD